MRKILGLSAASVLALALTACGGSADDAGEPTTDAADGAEVAAAQGAAGAAGAAAAGTGEAAGAATGEAAADEPAPAASASASATPSPTPTPTRTPAPPAARVAAAGPPAAFATCGVCHSVNAGENRIGPSLAGVVGRRAGSVAGANYSPAMQGVSISWTERNLDRYLADPAAIVPGGTMPNPGVDAAKRRAIIDYLKTL